MGTVTSLCARRIDGVCREDCCCGGCGTEEVGVSRVNAGNPREA